MFETSASARHESSGGAAATALDAGTVATWQCSLSQAVAASGGLDDAGRVDAIRALEELVCTATAAQARLTAELDTSQRSRQAEAGVPAARRGRGVAAQVALARRESHRRGRRHLGLARIVGDELPHTWSAWRAGRITEWTATLVARETACLSREDRAAVDAVVAGDPDRLEAMGPREVEAACLREAVRLDAASVVARRRRAESERHVSLRPAPDSMTWLTALLPVKDGVAVHTALTRAADTARAAGDGRARGQVMADSLVAGVLGSAGRRDRAATRWEPTPDEDAPSAPRAGIQLGLVMTDLSLFGTTEDSAHLHGHGPIPAELARELVVGACSGQEQVWLRRLYTSPATGELVSMDSAARLFRASLARFIRLRDQICRTPWCDAPIRHSDHAVGHGTGGATSAANGQGLCEACNHAKQAPGWRARPSPGAAGHEVETTTPTGHHHRSRPPTVATIRETPIRVEYVLAG
jgi:hypothetical protein